MKLTIKKFLFSFLVLAAVVCSACKSTKGPAGEGKEQAFRNSLTKIDGALLWKIEGPAKDGSASTVYLLGTYHAGDDRMTGFPECVRSALDSSDRFCCELSKTDWENFSQLVTDRTMQSVLTDFSHTFIDDLTQEEILLISSIIDQQTLAQLVCFEPWVLNNTLQSVLIMASGLDTTKAYDIMIMDELNTKNADFEGLDEAQTQLDLMAYGDWDTQLIMLRDTLKDIMNLADSAKEMSDLYEIFLTGDDKAFEQAYYKDLDKEIKDEPVYAQYIKELLLDRNEKWAVKIQDYIDMGGTTFVFAGSAHFTGPDSVFECMYRNGTLQ